MEQAWIPWTLSSAVSSPWICGNHYVELLEQHFASASGEPRVIAVPDGRTALALTLRALGIGPGDEVVFPALGFAGIPQIAAALGAQAVPADISPSSWCLDPKSVAQVVTDRTRVILAVHLHGHMADLTTLRAIADETNAALIDHAAEAVFPQLQGQPTTMLANLSTHSLHASPAQGISSCGIIMTADEDLYDRLKYTRAYADIAVEPSGHRCARSAFLLTNLQAAMAFAHAQRLHDLRADRARVHESYRRRLHNQPGLRQQQTAAPANPIVWSHMSRIIAAINDLTAIESDRDELIRRIGQRGIEVRRGFDAPRSWLNACSARFPNACQIAAGALAFPTYPSLSDETLERICAALERSLWEAVLKRA
jgi:perosamine synthetase